MFPFIDVLLNKSKPQTRTIQVGSEMEQAFIDGVEWYMPVLSEMELREEGGHSESSYKNLRMLIKKFGKPFCVERQANGNVLVRFDEVCYLATGFDCGYMGAGPYYFSCFGEIAGFGDCDELYMKISVMDRRFVGVVWGQKRDS